MLFRGLLSGPKIALVIGVDAVGNGVESTVCAKTFENGEEFVLAVEAARSIIADVVGIFEFVGFNDGDGDVVVAGKSEGLLEMSSSETGGVGDHGEHLAAEDLVRHPC